MVLKVCFNFYRYCVEMYIFVIKNILLYYVAENFSFFCILSNFLYSNISNSCLIDEKNVISLLPDSSSNISRSLIFLSFDMTIINENMLILSPEVTKGLSFPARWEKAGPHYQPEEMEADYVNPSK